MRLFLIYLLITILSTSFAFRLVIRLCFKDNITPDAVAECAYCNPRTLQRIMKNCTNTKDGIPSTIWNDIEKRCILRTCRQEYPSQKTLPTINPMKTLHF
ncbi:hypothetical protein JTE90_007845 [Oedothorax gibbosus]|uniref:Uncharacterized protein n=1 Tax=Oedothorax gibbosus TaxID=931172 RepID=A0AAV6VHF0_9ARAC|nr:hypothetical protein JTE90_007845 [Oedothorax gibbosus]